MAHKEWYEAFEHKIKTPNGLAKIIGEDEEGNYVVKMFNGGAAVFGKDEVSLAKAIHPVQKHFGEKL